MDWDWDLDLDSDSDWWDSGQSPSEVGLLLPAKADLIPVEILSEIFLLIVQDSSGYRRDLVLVCRRWHAIILSTPGIHAQLTIRRATQKEVVQAFIQGRKSRLHVRVDINDEQDGSDFNAENFHACFAAASQVASRWSSLTLVSPPPHGEYKALQILPLLTHLESFDLACDFGEFGKALMIAISRGASPKLTAMRLEDPAAVLYLVQPVGLHITHGLTTLNIQLSKKMSSPVNILPHLHRLEHFDARNLCLPFYPPDTTLSLSRTLRFLYLRSVSVQWMAGHVFPALEECEVNFPHNADIIQALQPVTMPSCSYFLYHSNDLHPFAHFHLPSLKMLDVKSGQWNVWRGNPQLAALCPVFSAGAKSLTELRLDVECSEQLLVHMLNLVPVLKHLWLGVARPNALSTTFFQEFIVREPSADGASDVVGPPSQAIAPLCPSLDSLDLHYRRWLRGPDDRALIVAFGDIMASRNSNIHNSFELELSFDETLEESNWSIDKPVTKSQGLGHAGLILGISVPHGIIPVSTTLTRNGVVALPLKEAEYLYLRHPYFISSLEFLFTHDHMELMVYDYHRLSLPTPLPCALPLFYALRVLVVEDTNPLFLAGHTFPKLERCRVVDSRNHFVPPPSLFTRTEMPVCTRIDIDDPHLLATFKLPQIYEVALNFSHPDCSTIWEKNIAVNANLSGLTFLHIKKEPFDGDLIPILRSLSSLETLIISSRRSVVSLRALLPMDANGASGLKQMSGEGGSLALLCPRLQDLQIEEWKGRDTLAQAELDVTLMDVVFLRAKCGSPLKSFTFFGIWTMRGSMVGSKVELIGKDGTFTMKEFVLDKKPEKGFGFKLDV